MYRYNDAEERNDFNDKNSNYLKSKILNRCKIEIFKYSLKNSYMSNTNKFNF